MIEWCLLIPSTYFIYWVFCGEEENNGELTVQGRRYGKEIEIKKNKREKKSKEE